MAPSRRYFQRVDHLRRLTRELGLNFLIVVAAVVAAAQVALAEGARAPEVSPWFAVPAVALVVLPLLVRARFPFAAPVAVWTLAATVSFVDGRLVPFAASVLVAGLAAALLLGNLREDRVARLGLGIVLAGAAIVVYNNPDHDPGELLFTPLLFAIAWLAGFAMRERAQQAEAAELRATQAEREREAAARVAVAEERVRIARELHDIVAHSVSVMVLQVGAVRHRLVDVSEEDREALASVEGTGRTALSEMRRLLGAMRREGDDVDLAPQPGIDGLEAVVDEVRRTGIQVDFQVDGEPFPVPHGIGVSAYRIVQEGLTNVLKHAKASRADVSVRYGDAELAIEVRDDGAGASESIPGYGLAGMRERVKIYGGDMTAGPQSEGGFTLKARLPVQERGS